MYTTIELHIAGYNPFGGKLKFNRILIIKNKHFQLSRKFDVLQISQIIATRKLIAIYCNVQMMTYLN